MNYSIFKTQSSNFLTHFFEKKIDINYLGLKWTDAEGDIHTLGSLEWKVACKDIYIFCLFNYMRFKRKKHYLNHNKCRVGTHLNLALYTGIVVEACKFEM